MGHLTRAVGELPADGCRSNTAQIARPDLELLKEKLTGPKQPRQQSEFRLWGGRYMQKHVYGSVSSHIWDSSAPCAPGGCSTWRCRSATRQRYQSFLAQDPDRCGILPFVFDDDFGFARYAEFALDVPMYFVSRCALMLLALPDA